MSPTDPLDADLPVLTPEPIPMARAGGVSRTVAGLVGLMVLFLASILTAGGALTATLGTLVAVAVAHRRARPIGRMGSWFAAVGGAALACLVGAALLYSKTTEKSRAEFVHVMDSVQVQSQHTPPPPWLERVAPGAEARSKANQAILGPRVTKGLAVWGAVVGVGMAMGMFSLVLGTLGWVAALLLVFALAGRWIGGREQPSPIAV